MSTSLAELLDGLGARIDHAPDTPIDDLCYDSREAGPGALFIALRGENSDGHRFAAGAIAAGASALLAEERPSDVPAGFPLATVSDTRAVLPELAARFFDHPARALTLIGVTGTNGKTSTVRMIESILTAAGRQAGSLGTISVRFAGVEEPARLTTPESVDLQRSLARMRDAGTEMVALEVSSHSLALGRVQGLRFAAAVYTHLSQDHLDFHHDMDSYADAKAMLFGPDHLDGTAVLNAADKHSARFAEIARKHGHPVLTFARGKASTADIHTIEEHVELSGSRVRVRTPHGERVLSIPLAGDFQIDNALAAAAAASALDIDWDAIASGLSDCPPVPGRLERVADTLPIVLVDYAHTPDALDAVLSRVRPLVRDRLICVFGCGGDRDRTKRAPMARAACAHCHYVIATSDNPRSEDPDAILRDVSEGLSGSYTVVRDRRAAIMQAIRLAGENDVVVIAGKGHEDYQILADGRIDFDDRVEARKALRARDELE